jgi:hypothetical protein
MRGSSTSVGTRKNSLIASLMLSSIACIVSVVLQKDPCIGKNITNILQGICLLLAKESGDLKMPYILYSLLPLRYAEKERYDLIEKKAMLY